VVATPAAAFPLAMALAFARKLVSKKKKRFISKEDNFNLDLTCAWPDRCVGVPTLPG
jgi:hypothetical protein